MDKYSVLRCSLFFLFTLNLLTEIQAQWKQEVFSIHTIHYKKTDQENITGYVKSIAAGTNQVEASLQSSFKQKFDVYIHPNRHSLDSTWQKDWGAPEFQSECWMVASGIATKLDLLSPKIWKTDACEHNPTDTTATQQLITHELIHVFHGQHNVSPDFSDVTGLDWFVEGLATYLSGQCDKRRISEVVKVVRENTAPTALDNFWKGSLRYGLSGSIVMFIDQRFGRETLVKLLPYQRKDSLLAKLDVSEEELLTQWRKFMLEL